jgi:hypothetical protein
MADYRRPLDEGPLRPERAAGDEGRAWFNDVVPADHEGEVTLTGSVSSRDQKRRAEDVAERISGVKDVTNQLRVTRDVVSHDWAADSSRASGPGTSASQPATQASGKGTPSTSTTGSTA